jgi:SAM-dependent methyltransferase
MSEQIIGLPEWLQTPPGQYLLEWEQAQFDLAVADLFGYNALQLGLPELWALKTNRMPHRWLALPEEAVAPEGTLQQPLANAKASKQAGTVDSLRPRVALVTDSAALPFPPDSLDLVVLPHTLEMSADPHHVLREVERVLVPEGRVVISGLNPASLENAKNAMNMISIASRYSFPCPLPMINATPACATAVPTAPINSSFLRPNLSMTRSAIMVAMRFAAPMAIACRSEDILSKPADAKMSLR